MTIRTAEQIATKHARAVATYDDGEPITGTTEGLAEIIQAAIEADRAQRSEIYIVQNEAGDVVDVFRDADEATAAHQDGYSVIEETAWEPGEYAAVRIQELTREWEEATNWGADEPHRASDYALSEDDWKAGLSNDDAREIAALIEWREAQK